jgi:divalent metal cation (Fe/Co/Zn/Cd) transporter
VVITILIVWEAIQRFQHPQPVAGVTMMVIVAAGLLANILAFWILHRGSEEANLNVRRGAARAGRSAGFGRGDRCRNGDPHHRLDACRSDSVRAGFVPGIAQRLAIAAGERE